MTNISTFRNWVTIIHSENLARLRLFCFPYAGGGTSIFRMWQNDLPLSVELCLVQLPGRESRLLESPFTQLTSLIKTLANVLLPYMDIPFVFFGHSMGALIAFELARELRRLKSPVPLHLFVSSRPAPQVPNPHPSIHQLDENKFIEALRKFNGTPEEILQNAELMQLFSPLLRADFKISETYVYSNDAPFDYSISAFGGTQDSIVTYDHLAAWHVHTHKSFSLRMFPGDHFFLQSAQKLLLHAISQDITQFTSSSFR